MDLNKIYEAQKNLYDSVARLQNLSDAIFRSGNYNLAQSLEVIANNIITDTDEIIETISQGIHDDYVDAQNQFGSILSAMARVIDGDDND